MNKLLRANFSRLFRSKIFYTGIGIMLIYPVFSIISQYFDAQSYSYIAWLEDSLWTSGAILPFIMGVLVPTFIGTEYSDKTLRNKLIVGHTKQKIYISNMITMLTAAVIMLLIWNIVYFSLGIALLSIGKTIFTDFLICLETLMASLLFTALLVMISMFVSSKSGSSVLCLLTVLILIFFGVWLLTKLSQEEYISGYRLYSTYITDDEDEPVDLEDTELTTWEEMVPNPDYIPEGSQRNCMIMIRNISVGAQIIDNETDHQVGPIWFFLFDPAMILLITYGGAFLFRRKDIC